MPFSLTQGEVLFPHRLFLPSIILHAMYHTVLKEPQSLKIKMTLLSEWGYNRKEARMPCSTIGAATHKTNLGGSSFAINKITSLSECKPTARFECDFWGMSGRCSSCTPLPSSLYVIHPTIMARNSITRRSTNSLDWVVWNAHEHSHRLVAQVAPM